MAFSDSSPVKHFHRRAGHEDVIVVGPAEFEIAARQMGEDLAIGAAR